MGYAMPFLTIIASLGSPLTGRIFDTTGSCMLAWQIAITDYVNPGNRPYSYKYRLTPVSGDFSLEINRPF